jgi:hypothetical protein
MKMDMLREAHYVYNFDRELFFNRSTKKAFSFPFIDDHCEEELARSIQESSENDGWKFYFNFPPTEKKKRELEGILS